MAMDYSQTYAMAMGTFPGGGFPGFAYLSQLATRAEFRAFAASMSTELTREWITFTSTQNDGDETGDKIKQIENEFKRLDVRNVIRKAAEQDCYFGRAQVFVDITGADRNMPLILDPRTVKKGSFNSVCSVEAIWTTPSAYNALDPAAPDFYKPTKWFMLGQQVHASRLLTIVTRELPDILKPAFNFGGMSLSQLAEPYVDNWLRTRQSISDLLNNFSITALKTAMSQLLQGEDDGAGVIDRAKLFTAMRSNQGLMLLDKDVEELVQLNVPLSGLHELQAQSQEQMCSVSHTPSTVLLGVAPSGFGNVAEGETQMWRDWISAQQEANWRSPLEIILKVVQLSLFGTIDPDITLDFVPLFQMDPGDLADIRLKDSQAGTAYINAGVIDPAEERERLASDPESGYHGLDVDKEIVPPNQPMENESEPGEEEKPEQNPNKRAQDIALDADNYNDLICLAGGNPADFDPEQFSMGLKIEQEHFGTTTGNEIEMAGIVLDHLREIPDYYTRLARMEASAKQ
jgi:phage-related protein (TIGR01555 family)